jgi:hypothetical protein
LTGDERLLHEVRHHRINITRVAKPEVNAKTQGAKRLNTVY